MSRRAEITIDLLAGFFSLLGAITLLAFPVGFREGWPENLSIHLALLAMGYGVLALSTGVLLHRRSELAPRVFIVWAATLIAFIASVPEMRIPLAVPAYALGLAMLIWTYRYVTRYLGSRAADRPTSVGPL